MTTSPPRRLESHDGTLLAEITEAGLSLYQLPGRELIGQRPGVQARLAAFSPDRTLLATEESDTRLSVWKLPSLEPVVSLEEEPPGYWAAQTFVSHSAAFSPDGRSLAVVKKRFLYRFGHVDEDVYSSALLLWELQAEVNAQIASSEPGIDFVQVGFSTDGTLLTLSEDGELSCWRAPQLKWLRSLALDSASTQLRQQWREARENSYGKLEPP